MENPTNCKPLFLFIAEAVTALHNVQNRQAAGIASRGEIAGTDWGIIWRDRLEQAARDLLPGGSGFNNGTQIDLDASRADRITLKTAFHHMSANGFYDGWTQHKIHLVPAFGGFDMRVTGKDRNGIKEYIAETVGAALEARVGYVPDPAGDATGDGFPGTMRRAASGEGMAALRSRVCDYAGDAETAWKIAQSCGFDSPFDWEFCPWFVAACVDWETGGLVPDWADRCRAMGDADSKRAGAALDAINSGEPV